MKINIECNVENVEKYQGKNGFGANITVSQLIDKKRQLLTFNTSNAEYANLLEGKLQETVDLDLERDVIHLLLIVMRIKKIIIMYII